MLVFRLINVDLWQIIHCFVPGILSGSKVNLFSIQMKFISCICKDHEINSFQLHMDRWAWISDCLWLVSFIYGLRHVLYPKHSTEFLCYFNRSKILPRNIWISLSVFRNSKSTNLSYFEFSLDLLEWMIVIVHIPKQLYSFIFVLYILCQMHLQLMFSNWMSFLSSLN